MLELIQMHPIGTNITDATPVYVVTKTGADCTAEGIELIKSKIQDDFNDNSELTIFTSIALNNPKLLKDRLQSNPDSYVILPSKDNVILIPKNRSHDICDNIDEKLQENPKSTSWEILIKSCNQKLY